MSKFAAMIPRMLQRYLLLVPFLLLAGASLLSAQSYPTLRWQKFYGTEFDDAPYRIIKSPDGNLLLGGNIGTGNSPDDCSDVYVVKVDTLGRQLWERRFGGSGCDELRDLVITPDSGVIFVGTTGSFIDHPEKGQDNYKGDYFIGKLTKDGDIDWLKSYGGLDIDQAYAVVRSETWPEYFVVGASHSNNFDVSTDLQMSNMWCLKVDELGGKLDAWSYGGNKHDWAYSAAACRNGDYLFAGYTNSEDIDGTNRRQNGDGWVGRLERNTGKVVWQRIYSGKLEDYFTHIFEDPDGRIVLCGNFESEKKGKQFWFLKLTADGKKIYERIFGDAMDEYATTIRPTADGGYIMTGYSKYINLTNKYIKGGEDFWVFRLNGRGDVIWTNTFGGRDDERGIDIVEYRPGVYFALGQKENTFSDGKSSRGNDFWLLRIDENTCEDVDVKIYSSLTENTTDVGKNFKLKALCRKGEGFLWDFGDGNTSREKEPVHQYESPGVYQISVTVFINENCSKKVDMDKYIMVW